MAALVLAMGLTTQAARAQDNGNIFTFLFGHQDPRLTATGIAVGAGAAAGSYALAHKRGTPATRIMSPGFAYAVTSYGCAVVYPMIATLVVNRPLTPREAYTGIANCVVPIIGGWISDAIFGGNPWYEGAPPAPPHHMRHHHHPA